MTIGVLALTVAALFSGAAFAVRTALGATATLAFLRALMRR